MKEPARANRDKHDQEGTSQDKEDFMSHTCPSLSLLLFAYPCLFPLLKGLMIIFHIVIPAISRQFQPFPTLYSYFEPFLSTQALSSKFKPIPVLSIHIGHFMPFPVISNYFQAFSAISSLFLVFSSNLSPVPQSLSPQPMSAFCSQFQPSPAY